MKKILFVSIKIAVFIVAANLCSAQENSYLYEIRAGKSHTVWVFSKTDKLREIGKGELYQLYDDSLSIIKPYKTLLRVNTFSVQDIDQIWLRRKSKKMEGTIVGVIAGVLAGVVIGIISGDDPECHGWDCLFDVRMTAGEKALLGGIILAPIGGAIGLGVGSAKIKIPINRQKDEYLRVKDKLKTVLYSTPN